MRGENGPKLYLGDNWQGKSWVALPRAPGPSIIGLIAVGYQKKAVMAKIASNILSWNPANENYTLTGLENSADSGVFAQDKEWLDWLENHKSFAFHGQNGRLSLQKETRPSSQQSYWYAYQRQGKRMVKQYLGGSHDLTIERLEEAARNLAAKAQL